MYAYISGKVIQKNSDNAVIDANGVGYRILTDAFSLAELQTGQQGKLYTYLKVAEDDMSLFGFYTQRQEEMFEKLLNINGIGPKAALSVLSVMRVEDIAAAVFANDDKAFARAQGIGKKTAQRLVLELKEKVELPEITDDGGAPAAVGEANAVREAVEALTSLGYQRQDAFTAVSRVRNLGDTSEDYVRLALKRMGAR